SMTGGLAVRDGDVVCADGLRAGPVPALDAPQPWWMLAVEHRIEPLHLRSRIVAQQPGRDAAEGEQAEDVHGGHEPHPNDAVARRPGPPPALPSRISAFPARWCLPNGARGSAFRAFCAFRAF